MLEHFREESQKTEKVVEEEYIGRLPDPDAFGCLIELYHQRLFFFVKRMTFFSAEDIEDVLQNAYIKAYRNIFRYDKDMKFSTWLYQVVRNVTIDEIRKRAVRPTLYSLEDEMIPQTFISELKTDYGIMTAEDQEVLHKALRELPENYREVITLRYLEEKSYEEIMDIVKLPKGTVAAQINRAKKQLAANITTTNQFHAH